MGAFLKVVGSLFILSFLFVLFGIAQPGDGLIADIMANPRSIFSANFTLTAVKNLIGIESGSSSVEVEEGTSQKSFIQGVRYSLSLESLFAVISAGMVVGGLLFKRDELIYIGSFGLIMTTLGVYTIIVAPLPYPLDTAIAILLYILLFVLGLDWIRGRD